MEQNVTQLLRLIEALGDPAAHGGEAVTVHQTHISVVFVAKDRAYKLKKPADLGFVDYSTVQRRRHFCEAEVRLNERLAAGVYLGVRSVIAVGDSYRIGPPDASHAVDWVVEMRRLDDEDTLLHHLHNHSLQASWLEELGRKLAHFHTQYLAPEQRRYGSFDTIARNARENFAQSVSQIGITVDARVFDAARSATNAALGKLEPVIRARCDSGKTCDTHGDLRLEHVYRVEDELLVVDCIEFNDAFRFSDPVADLAFLVMDLRIRWAQSLACTLEASYFAAAPGGEELLDFYVAYRSAVRAKVHGIAALEPELDETARERALIKARAHWLFALSTLAEPADRPALLLVGGLPGTGKSTLARALRDVAGFEVIESDRVRKELAGVAATQSMRGELDAGIYTSEWTKRTYEECVRRAMAAVHRGSRVAVAATFQDDEWRHQMLRAGHAAGVPAVMLQCEVDREEVHRRLRARAEDVSDADVATYEHIASTWEAPTPFVAGRLSAISTLDADDAIGSACDVLRNFGML